ncbi:hypothetical protein K6H10_000760 [Candida tropicalis]
MSVPTLTIPESAFDSSMYSGNPARSKSQLLMYLLKLTNRSSFALVIIYLVGYFAIKPLMETNISRRLEYLDAVRGKLRDFYLKAITKVSHIPIVAIKRNGKLYADEIVQTNESKEESDKLSQDKLCKSLHKLSILLNEGIKSYSTTQLANYKSINYAIKDFQNKSDLVYFNQSELFVLDSNIKSPVVSGATMRKKDIAVETKNEIRSIKGLYMSGQA